MPFLSDFTACWIRPLEAFCAALDETLLLPMKIFWNASCVPEAGVRTSRLIGPVAVAPGTSLQSRTVPEKMPWIWSWEKLATGVSGLVMMQNASLAIFVQNMPPGSVGLG